jgi:hypothetical protein
MAQTTPTPASTAPARILKAPDSFPFVGLPGTGWEDGTLLLNEGSGEVYFWNANSTNPTMKWEPLS